MTTNPNTENSNTASTWAASQTTVLAVTCERDGSTEPYISQRRIVVPMLPRERLTQLSQATAELLAAFGLGGQVGRRMTLASLPPLNLLAPGVILCTGPSGSGKSQSIRLLSIAADADRRHHPPPPAPDLPLIESWPGLAASDAVARLTAVGLADPVTWVRTPSELSTGQRARLDLCRAIHAPGGLVLIDEFCNALDRVTARAVAWRASRIIRRLGLTAILATSHDDLAADVAPDLHVTCRWGGESSIEYPTAHAPACSVMDEITYEPGSLADWKLLAPLHYAAGDPATIAGVHLAKHPSMNTPAGVVVYSWPDLHSAARNVALGDGYAVGREQHAAARLNREVRRLSRIVVAPEVRGIGIAQQLILASLASLPESIRWVECVTALGPSAAFLRRIGFDEIPNCGSPSEAEWIEHCDRLNLPPAARLDALMLAEWTDTLSVREARKTRRLVWRLYHHLVAHRRTRRAAPRKIPGPNDRRWPEAWDVAARRLADRPAYHLLGPIDGLTGEPETAVRTV